MNWDLLRRECQALFARYAWKTHLGTFDTAVVASAKLAGGTRFLSFDTRAKALAAAEGLKVFPPLDAAGRRILSELKRSTMADPQPRFRGPGWKGPSARGIDRHV